MAFLKLSVKSVSHGNVRKRIDKAWDNTLAPLSELILADCNEYVRVDQGQLRQSSATASDFVKGKLIWRTPYAKRVYYTGTPSRDINPNASLMWADKAKDNHRKDWEKAAQKLMDKELR